MTEKALSVPVANASALTAHYGRWPSFHDAEVLNLQLNRGEGGQPPSLTLTCLLVDRPAIQGAPLLVTMSFHQVDELELSGFNEQNALFDLTLTLAERLIEVNLESSYGLSASFSCARVEIVDVHR
jgi:hypothetical protein